MDHYIVEARNSSVDEQRKLFFRFARHLFDNQVRDSVSERNDPKNDEAWLVCLAEWFGWNDGLREEVIQEAAEAAWVVLPGENPDSGEADEGIRD